MDLFENDYIRVTGKIQAAEHIAEHYGDFGWRLEKSEDDKLYCDVTHMTFTRPHFIENKDELQLLQVRLEIAYNETGRLAHRATLRTLIIGSLFGLLSAAFAVAGVLLIIYLEGVLSVALGSALCVLGVATGILGGIVSYFIYKKDRKKYAARIREVTERIESLCASARRLRGEDA